MSIFLIFDQIINLIFNFPESKCGGKCNPINKKKKKCQGRGQLFVKVGPKPKILDLFADSMQRNCANEVSLDWLGSRACLMALEVLGFFITKYAFSPF